MHVDLLQGEVADFLVLTNRAEQARELTLSVAGRWRGLFSGRDFSWSAGATQTIPGHFNDILRRES